jgi:hypothetical protein
MGGRTEVSVILLFYEFTESFFLWCSSTLDKYVHRREYVMSAKSSISSPDSRSILIPSE